MLFIDAFFVYNSTYQIGGTEYNGYMRLGNFFRNILSHEWGYSPYHFLTYAMVLFLLISSLLLLRMMLRFIFTLGTFGRGQKLYSKAVWFLFATIIFSGVYLWYILAATSTEGATQLSFRTITPWFFVPIVAGIICTTMSGILRDSELR